MLETAVMRFRRFVEQRLPALVEGIARSWIESLGLAAVPVEVSDVDAFGMSQEFVERWQPMLARMLTDYLGAELRGLEKLPAEGPALLICSHSGVLPGVGPGMLPYDELLLKVAVRERGKGISPGRDIRPLCEDFAINAPFVGSFLNRFGLVRRSPDNAERLLRAGHVVAVFEDSFTELAQRIGAPVYPIALGPIGLLPPRWNVRVGDELRVSGGEAAAEDQSTVARVTDEVREKIQRMLAGLER